MKRCPHCKQFRDEAEFSKNRHRKDGLQAHCRQCTKQIQHDWYRKHKETHYANVMRRRREHSDGITENLIAYFKTHPCMDCGEDDPLILEFDHVNGSKKFSIANRFAQGYNWQTLLKEIEKCEVRCANCHRRKTARQQGHRKVLLIDQ